MWDDIIDELVESGEVEGEGTDTRTGADGIIRTIKFAVPAKGNLKDDANWAEAALEGINTTEEYLHSPDDDDRKKDKRTRSFKMITGKRAAKMVNRFNGVEQAPEKQKVKKRTGAVDTIDRSKVNGELDPLANGQHS